MNFRTTSLLTIAFTAAAQAFPAAGSRAVTPPAEHDLKAHVAFGPEYSNYTHEMNRLMDDPVGGSVEIGFGGRKTRLQLRAAGVTQPARRTQSLSGDTILQGNSLTILRWAVVMSRQTFLTPKVYLGALYGLEWGTLGRPNNEEDRQPDISVPVTSGALLGFYAGHNVYSIRKIGMDFGYRIEYTYSSMDFRVYNPDLGYGRHGIALKFYFGN